MAQQSTPSLQLDALKRAGIPGGLLSERSVGYWRTSTSKTAKLHSTSSCAKISGRSRNRAMVVSIRLWDHADSEFCSHCGGAVPDETLADYLKAAREIVWRGRQIADHAKPAGGAGTLIDVAVVGQAVQAVLRASRKYAAFSDMSQAIVNTTREMLDGPLAGLSGQQGRDLVEVSCAVDLAAARFASSTGQGRPPVIVDEDGNELDLTCLGMSRWGHSPTLNAAWAAFNKAVRTHGIDTTDAVSCVGAAMNTSMAKPYMLAAIPMATRLNKADFDSPTAWALAEWREVFDELIARLVVGWTTSVQQERSGGPWSTITLPAGMMKAQLRAPGGTANDEALANAIAVLYPSAVRGDGTLVTSVPPVIQRWVQARADYWRGSARVASQGATSLIGEGVTQAVLSCAVVLADDGMALADALLAARAACM